jgi:polysaccharide export outer membrane protein
MIAEDAIRRKVFRYIKRGIVVAALGALSSSVPLAAQQAATVKPAPQSATPSSRGETTQDLNLKIQQMGRGAVALGLNSNAGDYQIGPEDLLQISVLEAPDLDRTVRVSDDGEISLPLLGTVQAAGLTSRGLEAVLENLLRHTYMKNPHVSVFVKEMKSHPVSVFGAVEKPGVYQIREPKTLIEVLSMAEGLATDAGDTVIVMRHPGDPGIPVAGSSPSATDGLRYVKAASVQPSEPSSNAEAGSASIDISLKKLLDSNDARYNVPVYPGDVVKVTRAGIVYVVGEVRRPGGFLLKTNENISVLQALALAEGLTPTAESKHARLILASKANGARTQVAIDLNKILKGKAPDQLLQANDILFIPNSSRKSVLHGFVQSMGGIATAVSGAAVYRY